MGKKPKNLSLEISMNNNLMQIFKDDEFVCIRDKFPKAKFHALIIPISNEENDEFLNLESGLDILVANPAACAESISLHKSCFNAIYYDLSLWRVRSR